MIKSAMLVSLALSVLVTATFAEIQCIKDYDNQESEPCAGKNSYRTPSFSYIWCCESTDLFPSTKANWIMNRYTVKCSCQTLSEMCRQQPARCQ
ncbi:hypothetical protein RRG08_040104 [Elysia crispata]|uniref:Uncharacterized protein n=1 Tax=Elysia crispata TaxID=231223 RepID=A0AAE0XVW6_9GAST|nr:hypothetical protein RRG08_040104 [Elysia crispata]